MDALMIRKLSIGRGTGAISFGPAGMVSGWVPDRKSIDREKVLAGKVNGLQSTFAPMVTAENGDPVNLRQSPNDDEN